MKTSFELLKEWNDHDIVCHLIAVGLGVVPAEDVDEACGKYKATYWTNNPLGNYLGECLITFVVLDFMECDGDADKYRWAGNMQESEIGIAILSIMKKKAMEAATLYQQQKTVRLAAQIADAL